MFARSRRPAPNRGGLPGLVLPMLLMFLLAACAATTSGGVVTLESAKPTAAATAVPEAPDQALLDFGACMRGEGIDMEDPTIDGGGLRAVFRDGLDPQSPEVQAALDVCRDILAGVVGGRGNGGGMSAEQEEALLAFADCMRGEGVPVGDPAGGLMSMLHGGGVEPGSPEFQAGMDVCRDYLSAAMGLGH
jgi:hypothetical protein